MPRQAGCMSSSQDSSIGRQQAFVLGMQQRKEVGGVKKNLSTKMRGFEIRRVNFGGWGGVQFIKCSLERYYCPLWASQG